MVALLALAGCAPPAAPQEGVWGAPQRIEIVGYDGDAMEPALSRDGAVLFFNNRNHPPERTDLHWAERIDETHFRYRGLVEGVNGPALDAVATMSEDGRFCFVSTRSYFEDYATIFCGRWRDGRVSDIAPQKGASVRVLGRLMFDVEIDAAGETLVLADGVFRGGQAPASADLRIARWRDGGFQLAPELDAQVAALNSDVLEYAAALSNDGLTITFTRLSGPFLFARASLWIASRTSADAAFGAPARIEAAEGFVEAGTFSPDARALIYHRREGDRFRLWRVAR